MDGRAPATSARIGATNHFQSMTPNHSRSQQLYERALAFCPGGVSRNTVLRRPHPFYADKRRGMLSDRRGRKTRIDFANNMASLIHGHAHPVILDAVTGQLQKGTGFTFATEVEIDLAEHITRRTKGFEQIRFVNSGTEAVLCCLKAARAFTGRPKIAKVEGAYHGLYDYAEVSQTAQPGNWGEADQPRSIAVAHGTPPSALDEVDRHPVQQPESRAGHFGSARGGTGLRAGGSDAASRRLHPGNGPFYRGAAELDATARRAACF